MMALGSRRRSRHSPCLAAAPDLLAEVARGEFRHLLVAGHLRSPPRTSAGTAAASHENAGHRRCRWPGVVVTGGAAEQPVVQDSKRKGRRR